MHLFAPEIGMMGTSGIVGPCILQAAGAGYSFQLLETDRVAVAFFGDGAVNNGAFHEGLNLAAVGVAQIEDRRRRLTELRHRHSAVDDERRAIDMRCGIRRQERHARTMASLISAPRRLVQRMASRISRGCG